MKQNQVIKGFTLLELLVVLVLIGIISAVGYPSMSGWRTDRDVRSATEKISNLFTNITIRTKNNSYPYVQVNINKPKGDLISITSKGMPQELFNDKLNSSASIKCTDADWDSTSKVQTIGTYQLVDEVFINMSSGTGSVCFSTDGAYFEKTGEILDFLNVTAPGGKESDDETDNYIIVCSARDSSYNLECPTESDKLKKPAYLIQWSRFGVINKYRWNDKDSVWVRN